MNPTIKGLAILSSWELAWWFRRRSLRGRMFERARRRATLIQRPLAVVGAPDSWSTGGYPCGDVTIDIADSDCPNLYRLDITEPLPFDDDSLVVFVSCVLEYVDDFDSAVTELYRISGGNLYNVRVEPWTLTAYLYPGRKRTTSNIGLFK